MRLVSDFKGPVLLAAALGRKGLTKAEFYAGGSEDFEQLGRNQLPLEEAPGISGDKTQAKALVWGNQQAGYRLQSDQGALRMIPFYDVGLDRYSIYFPMR